MSHAHSEQQTRRPTCRFVGGVAVRTWWLLLILIGLSAQMWGVTRSNAQDVQRPGDASPPPAVEEVKPSGFYLKNEKGELIYVPDVSYEQFEQLLKIQRNLTDQQQPAFVLADMTMDAVATENRMEMDVTFTLHGRALDGVAAGTWLHVPLRFDDAFLSQEPTFAGPGAHFLTYDSAQGGYVCWLQSGGDASHTVVLRLVLPVDQLGGESRVNLSVPTPLASLLRLKVPAKMAEGLVRDLADATGRPLTFEATADGQGQFTARGIRGDVALSWHAANETEKAGDKRLDVMGEVVVTADEMLQEIRSDGRFKVRGFGGPIESFQVRLPAGMRWRESPEAGYSVRPVPATDPASADQVVEVRLDRPTAGEVEIQLVAEMPTTSDGSDTAMTVSKLVDQGAAFEPARFEFLGAVRHHGHIELVVHGDWAFEDRDDPEFPRVGPGAPATSPNTLVARYRYHNQQRSLQVSIRQKATRVSVEPRYTIHVNSQQARLIAELVCSTSGSRAGPLALRLPIWKVELVHFDGVDSPLPVDPSETNPLIVPMPVEVQAAKQFKLRIEAVQDLTASVVSGMGPLRLVLPMLEATNPSRANVIVSPATVVVIPAPNVLLTPRPQQMKSLSPLAPPSAAPGTADATVGSDAAGPPGATPFYYRDRGPPDQALFVGDVRIQPQAISVRIASTATLTRNSVEVEQRLSYNVLHEAVELLTFALPESLAPDASLKFGVFLDDQRLLPTLEPAVGSERPRVNVRLPQRKLGPVELKVVHPRQTLAGLSADADSRVTLPLLLPSTRPDSNTTVVDNALTVVCDDPLRVDAASNAWILDEGKSSGDKLVLTTTAESVAPVLRVSLRGASSAGTTVLSQVWIQSWLTPQHRRDRAVFRVRTRAAQVRVILPAAADARLIKLAVDRREVTVSGPGPSGEILVPVAGPSDGTLHEHVLEVWYALTPRPGLQGSCDLQSAMVDGADRVERTYWQVILPGNEVVVSRDPRLIPDRQWQWDGVGWRRQAARDQAELEQWIGASVQDPVPVGTNRYLFTALGVVNRLELTTMSRSWILMACSGVALGVGLLLLYVPLLRHPLLLLVAGIATWVSSLVWPDWSVLFAQGAILGVLLAVAAHVCRQVLWTVYAVTPAFRGRAQFSDSKIKVADSGARGDGSSKVTATASPMSVQVPAAESKP
jgi:hypothetical protein